MKFTLPAILFFLFTFTAFSSCRTDKRDDHDLNDTTEKAVDFSKQTPQQVVQSLYEAINDQRYEDAYRLWDQDGKASQKTLPEFKRGYEQTVQTEVTVIGQTTTEGAAGSLYAKVPVRIEAELTSGKQLFFTGYYVLRRRNVPQNSLADPWRIYDAELEKGD